MNFAKVRLVEVSTPTTFEEELYLSIGQFLGLPIREVIEDDLVCEYRLYVLDKPNVRIAISGSQLEIGIHTFALDDCDFLDHVKEVADRPHGFDYHPNEIRKWISKKCVKPAKRLKKLFKNG